jgi:hypothetical protein
LDARYRGIARIEYPLHPLFGRQGKVVRRVRYDFGACLEVEVDEVIVNLPHWMTRADHCQRFACGFDPVPQLVEVLSQLLLDALPRCGDLSNATDITTENDHES